MCLRFICFKIHFYPYYVFSAFTGYETNNKYEILNSLGQRVYHAVEGKCDITEKGCDVMKKGCKCDVTDKEFKYDVIHEGCKFVVTDKG